MQNGHVETADHPSCEKDQIHTEKKKRAAKEKNKQKHTQNKQTTSQSGACTY